ncbi:MAG: hypothetical protein M1837_006410 [Sclerophora amabilis]|nr:MAG: hypothetical protein M1837_006410 [Sclerophora amabilis]
MATLVSRPLLRSEITYSEARTEDVDILKQLTYVDAREKFFNYLAAQEHQIKSIVARHLRLTKAETCSIPSMTEWLHGSFNVGLPVAIEGWRECPGRRVLIRFPLPYKIGESFRPGNVDEKLRCEAATYAWVNQHCPDVPIPHLWGFGLSNGQIFTALEHTPLLSRSLQYVWRGFLHLLRHPVPSRYLPRSNLHGLGVGYLLTDFIEERDGSMLTKTWEQRRQDKTLQANLFRDLSRIILSLGHLPLPRVGSFTIDDGGFVSVTNRPLTLGLHKMENDDIPIDIPRHLTYSTTESYVLDLLHCHRMRLTHQPNAVHSRHDGVNQVSAMTVMETVFSHFFDRRLRYGPFVLTLTDLHHSNIFVDDQWHITGVVDLEWACTLPLEMQHPPYWLTSQSVDTIDVDLYDQIRLDFMDIFEQEERKLHLKEQGHGKEVCRRADIMRKGWESKNFWYCLALWSPTGLHYLLYDHIQPMFHPDGRDTAFFSTMPRYWMPGLSRFLDNKVKEQEEYDFRLRKQFESSEGSEAM